MFLKFFHNFPNRPSLLDTLNTHNSSWLARSGCFSGRRRPSRLSVSPSVQAEVSEWKICTYERVELYCSSEQRLRVCVSSITSSHISSSFRLLQPVEKHRLPLCSSRPPSSPLFSCLLLSSCFFFFSLASSLLISSPSPPLLSSPPLLLPPLSYLSVLVKGQCEHKGLLW